MSNLSNYYIIKRFLGRPTYLSADLCFTGILLSFFYLFSPHTLQALNGTQPKLETCSKVSAIWKRMSVIWGILYP